jgi:hypothetical protein
MAREEIGSARSDQGTQPQVGNRRRREAMRSDNAAGLTGLLLSMTPWGVMGVMGWLQPD